MKKAASSPTELRPPDEPALARLRGAIRAFVQSKLHAPALAEDITQEILVRLHQKFDTLRAGERLEAWVFQIARNAVADHFRTTRPTEEFNELVHAPALDATAHGPQAAEEEVLRRELATYVRRVVASLPPIYREALELTEFDGIPQVELARRLALTVSAAKSRVQRARAMARAELERCCRWETDRYGTVVDAQPRHPECCAPRPKPDG